MINADRYEKNAPCRSKNNQPGGITESGHGLERIHRINMAYGSVSDHLFDPLLSYTKDNHCTVWEGS